MSKKSRTVRSFEPDNDVGELLERASAAGLKLTDIINESVRQCGAEIVEKMAAKRLKDLEALSFEDPQLLMAGMIAA